MTDTSQTLVYVGTYTRSVPNAPEAHGIGIYVYRLDPATGALIPLSETPNIDSPSYLAISHDGRHLYAVSEVWLWDEGTVSAYAIDAATGALTYINKQVTLGALTAFVAVDWADRYVMTANYWSGAAAAIYPIRADGGLAPASDSVSHRDTPMMPMREEKPHAHCIVTEPSNRWVYVVDLGLDEIVTYELDHVNGRLIQYDVLTLETGMGCRQMILHPNGNFAYVICEYQPLILVLALDSETGTLMGFDKISTLPAGADPTDIHPADVQIHPSGRWLYGSNRGHNSLAIYAVDGDTGRLTFLGQQSTGGKTPRNFAIDPTGTFLLVAHQDSDTIVTFRIDQQTGLLADTGHVTDVPTPTCVKMIKQPRP